MGDTLVIWHFSSPTCSICTTQVEVLKEIENNTGIPFRDMPITSHFEKALRLGVQSAPALAFITDDKAVAVKTGFQNSAKIMETIERIAPGFSTQENI